MLVAWLVLTAVVLVGVALLARPAWSLVGLLAALAVVWLPVNQPVEGAVLLSLTDEHGLTVADLLVPVILAVLALSVVRLRSRRADSGDGRSAAGSAAPEAGEPKPR